jgi:DNA-directed RNA polymerase beta' subunit
MIDFENLQIVTSSKLYIDKHFKVPDPNGILSQQIFGPLINYRCECSKYSTKILYNNLRCDVCGVLCTHSNIRYTTFAKIKLHFKIIKKQNIPIFQKWLKNKKFILDPLQRDLYTSMGIYLKYVPSEDEIEIQDYYDPNNCLVLPLSITGIYTLYLGIYCIFQIYKSIKAKSLLNYFTDEILVTPPGTRPSIITDTVGTKKGVKTILSSELDNAYCKLLNIDAHNQKHVARANIDNYFKMINTSISLNTAIAISDDELKLFDEITSFYQYSYNQIYETINLLLTGKTGLIRSSFLGKSVDFSSRSVVINDPSLLTHEIKIPKATFIKLYFIEYLRFLQKNKGADYRILRQLIKNSETNNLNNNLSYLDEFIEYFFTQTSRKDRLIICNRVPSLNSIGDIKFH